MRIGTSSLALSVGVTDLRYLATLCRVLPLVSAMAFLLSTAAAQKPAKSHPATAQTADRYSLVPFDPSVEALPRGFRGHDPERIYAALKRAKLKKDEFESSDAYNRRMETLKGQPILGSLTLQSLYVFDLELVDGYRLPSDPSYSGRPVKPTYDADHGTMSILLSWSSSLDSNSELRSFRSKSRVMPRGSYIGSNAFGVARTIRSYRYDSYCLAVPDASSELRVAFGIAPDKARTVRHRVRLLLVGRLAEPFTLPDEQNAWPAEIDKPFEYIFTEHQIRFNPKYMIAYDPATGEIFGSSF